MTEAKIQMDSSDYAHARKEGLKGYSFAVQNGNDPLLPVLDRRLTNLNQMPRIELGVQTIRLKEVVGTETASRAFAFAWNFMPILNPSTEFASKWSNLCASVKENGVRESVKALEYMGLYYLIEGNKRVSVSKYLQMDYIEADVIRVLPVKTDEPKVKAYYEYCDFSQETGIMDIVFTVPGSYKKLMQIAHKKKGDKWEDEEIRDMRALFRYFRKGYEAQMRNQNCIDPTDAFLKFLIAFGYDQVKKLPEDMLAEKVRLMRTEFMIRNEAVTLIMDREPETGGSLLNAIFGPSMVKAAFLYTRSPEESGWNYWHEIGRLNAEKTMGIKLETKAIVVPSRTAFADTIDQLLKERYQLVFATSPVMLNSCIQPSMEHPELHLLCCSPMAGYNHVRSYYLRFFEGKFLMGIAAGALSRGGKIGYIADYPIYGSASTINAFALGVRMVSPESQVVLAWSTRMDFDPLNPFPDSDIRVICNRDINAPNHASNEYGLYIRENGRITNMAALIPNWNQFYSTIIEQVLYGTLESDVSKASKYWWGVSSGALEVVLSEHFDKVASRLIRTLEQQIQEGTFTPFSGVIRDQNGVLRCDGEKILTPAEILCMDYLVDNITGTFPHLHDLTDAARPVVRLQGIKSELKIDTSSISWTFNE